MNALTARVAGFLFNRLNRLVPKRPDYACFVSFPDLSDNAFELFRHLRRSTPSLTTIWLLSGDQSAESLRRQSGFEDYGPTVFARKYSLSGLVYLLRSRFVFFTHGIFSTYRPLEAQVSVNLWHGMPLKRIGRYLDNADATPHSTLTVAASEFFQPIMARAMGLPVERVLVSGQPRNDAMMQPDPALVERLLGRRRPERLVVWLPTYRASAANAGQPDSGVDVNATLLSDGFLREIDAALAGTGTLLVIKLHPMDINNDLAAGHYDHIRVFNNSDNLNVGNRLYHLLGMADALITDYSSCFIDFLARSTSIGFYNVDLADYRRGVIDPVLKEIGFPGLLLADRVALVDFIRQTHSAVVPASILQAAGAATAEQACARLAAMLDLAGP